MKPGKRSAVWVHFQQTDSKTVTCKYCKNNLKYHGNTSNMREHIKRRHIQHSASVVPPSVEQEPVDVIKNEIDIDVGEPYTVEAADSPPESPKRQCLARPGLRELTTVEREQLDTELVRMICKDFQPVSVVDNCGFAEFVTKLQPLYALPAKKTLSKRILPKLYESAAGALERRLERAETVAVSAEIWTGYSNDVFLTLTGHFASDEEEEMHSNVLETSNLEYNYGPEDIATGIDRILSKWNLSDKVVTVVAANEVQKAVGDFLKRPHHLCAARILDLIFTESLENNRDFAGILERCKTLVGHFETCVAAADSLRSVQRQLNLPQLKVKTAATDHWNSVFVMLERLSEMRVPLSIAITGPVRCLDPEEWTLVGEIVSLLRPFNEIAEELAREKYSTMSKVIPMIRGLQCSLGAQTGSQSEVVTTLQNSLIEATNSFLDLLETNEQVAKSTFLDPRFKKAGFGIAQNADNAEKLILEEIRLMTEESPTPTDGETQQHHESSLIWSYFDEKVRRSQGNDAANTTAALLVRQYLDLPLLNRNKDPFDFWKKYKNSFPGLYKLFLKYGSIPATSVQSDIMFTKYGQRANERRKSLPRKSLNEIVFLNANL